MLTFSQHLLTKNALSPEQAYLVLQFGHVCFWRSLVSQQVLTKCWNFWKLICHHQGYLSIILKFLYDAYNLKYWFLKKFSFSFCSSIEGYGKNRCLAWDFKLLQKLQFSSYEWNTNMFLVWFDQINVFKSFSKRFGK